MAQAVLEWRLALINIQPETIAWNTNLVKQEDVPKDWPDVLDPKWKGQIMTADPRNAISLMAWCQLMRQKYGDDFLRKYGAQQLKLVNSTVPGSQQMAAGAAALLVPDIHAPVAALQADKAPVADFVPDFTTGIEGPGAVVAKAPHPNAARLLFNYLLTPEGQHAQNAETGASSVLPNIPDTPPLPKNYTSLNLAEVKAASGQILELLGIH